MLQRDNPTFGVIDFEFFDSIVVTTLNPGPPFADNQARVTLIQRLSITQ